jgi:hypothetical protein
MFEISIKFSIVFTQFDLFQEKKIFTSQTPIKEETTKNTYRKMPILKNF